MEKKTIRIKDEKDTENFAKALAERARPGTVIGLIGDLGTGKTALSRYLARGLGIEEDITSPTFNIVKEYRSGRLPFFHFDVYRISDPEEMYEIGYEEYFFGEGICVVEWADIIEELLPEDAVIIRIEYGKEECERTYHIEW